MCMQDIAIGRRTIVKRTQFTGTDATQLAAGGNSRRIAFTFSGTSRALFWQSSEADSAGNRTNICRFADTNGPHENYAHIRDFGQLVIEPIYVNAAAGVVCTLIELVADDSLDSAIQKVVM